MAGQMVKLDLRATYMATIRIMEINVLYRYLWGRACKCCLCAV
jgi:hypothetical protein